MAKDWNSIIGNMATCFQNQCERAKATVRDLGERKAEAEAMGDTRGAAHHAREIAEAEANRDKWVRRLESAKGGKIPLHDADANDPEYMREYGRLAGEATEVGRVDWEREPAPSL